jgi:hypothetical protein
MAEANRFVINLHSDAQIRDESGDRHSLAEESELRWLRFALDETHQPLNHTPIAAYILSLEAIDNGMPEPAYLRYECIAKAS